MDTTIGNMVDAYLLDIKYKNFNKTAVKNLFFGGTKVLKEVRRLEKDVGGFCP